MATVGIGGREEEDSIADVEVVEESSRPVFTTCSDSDPNVLAESDKTIPTVQGLRVDEAKKDEREGEREIIEELTLLSFSSISRSLLCSSSISLCFSSDCDDGGR